MTDVLYRNEQNYLHSITLRQNQWTLQTNLIWWLHHVIHICLLTNTHTQIIHTLHTCGSLQCTVQVLTHNFCRFFIINPYMHFMTYKTIRMVKSRKSVYCYLRNTGFHQRHSWLNTPIFNRLNWVIHQFRRLDKYQRTRAQRGRGLKYTHTHTLKWLNSNALTDCNLQQHTPLPEEKPMARVH